ncbi:hypothetical protein ACFB49_12970 [Sphingomonas sp. DBB INV C78]|uniref:hypothetical protein n=1 Tax=Sphingomonas sp. DBB INV C78 TaxID=3349434 RepID=UPI0036D2D798
MASKSGITVRFVGLGDNEPAPAAALYLIDDGGLPTKKVATIDNGLLGVDPGRLKGSRIAIGPDVENPAGIDPATLIHYRADQVAQDWLERGLFIPEDRWSVLLRDIICVSGRVRKCRPWWYDLAVTTVATAKLGVQRRQALQRVGDLSAQSIILPFRCLPLCDGKVEVYERHCCCHHIVYDDLLDRLRDVLERIPVPIDGPNPPDPDPGPLRGLATRAPLRAALHSAALRRGSLRTAFPPPNKLPLEETTVSERVYHDYQALLRLHPSEVESFVLDRPYLSAFICHCNVRKVGEVFIQPGGEFDFCYWRPRRLEPFYHHCFTTFAYRVKQQINGIWTTVYDGVAGHDYFAEGEEADLHTSHPAARPCGDGPEPPDPGEGIPFVMLEHVTGAGTHHFNFPVQTGLSNVASLVADSGLYDFAGVPDAPWGGGLGLRLWFSPSLDGTVVYYRLKVVAVDAAGDPVGTPTVLDAPVAWSRYVFIGGDVKTTSTGLAANPADVGGEAGLFTVPYWSNGMNWLSGQFHQSWNTTDFADGRYMLIIELFGPGGARIKPNGSPAGDPGAAAAFQFRRWEAPDDTANVPFADCAHIFNVNNTPVVGDIFDLRKNHAPSTDECQFMSGPGTTLFSVGFRAYHEDGVTTGGGPTDTNSFMRGYTLTWQRGLNGPSGILETGTADQGELAVEESNTMDFATLLGPFPPSNNAHRRCTFSVHLHVDAKHHNGGSFIDAYDYHETASFALEIV